MRLFFIDLWAGTDSAFSEFFFFKFYWWYYFINWGVSSTKWRKTFHQKHFDRIFCFVSLVYHASYWYRFIFKWFSSGLDIRDNRFCLMRFKRSYSWMLCLLLFCKDFFYFCCYFFVYCCSFSFSSRSPAIAWYLRLCVLLNIVAFSLFTLSKNIIILFHTRFQL